MYFRISKIKQFADEKAVLTASRFNPDFKYFLDQKRLLFQFCIKASIFKSPWIGIKPQISNLMCTTYFWNNLNSSCALEVK